MKNLAIDLNVEPLEEGGFLATSKDLPGLIAEGKTVEETLDIAQDLARIIMKLHSDKNIPLPERIKQQIDKNPKKAKFKIPVYVA